MIKAFIINNGFLQAVNLEDLDKAAQRKTTDEIPTDPYIVLRSGERVRSSILLSAEKELES